MYLNKLSLRDFRNIESLELIPSAGVNVIYGENAQGKTNILESIYYLSLISSFRTSRDAELIRIGEAGARIDAEIYAEEREQSIRVNIPPSGRREVFINDVRAVKKADAAGKLKCVLFCPDDLNLVRDAAAGRRRFLDDAISQLFTNYISLTGEYNKLLQHKTRILKDYPENPSLLDALDDFSAGMCRAAAEIIPYRERYCDMLMAFAGAEHKKISSSREELTLEYKTVSTVTKRGLKPAEIYELLWQHYIRHKQAEISSRSCLSGPHKDDLIILIDSLSAKAYSSQGQTRTAALSLKLAQSELFRKYSGEYPILLFDDVFSELDHGRREYILRGIDHGQLFITTCEPEIYGEIINHSGDEDKIKMFHVKHGRVE